LLANSWPGFYARANNRNALMRRNKSTFACIGRFVLALPEPRETCHYSLRCRQQRTKLQLFQMDRGIDKIARRNENCGNKRLFGLTYH